MEKMEKYVIDTDIEFSHLPDLYQDLLPQMDQLQAIEIQTARISTMLAQMLVALKKYRGGQVQLMIREKSTWQQIQLLGLQDHFIQGQK